METQPLCPQTLDQQAPNAKPKGITTGQHHGLLLSLELIDQGSGLITRDEWGATPTLPTLQRFMQAMGGRHQGGLAQQLLLVEGQ